MIPQQNQYSGIGMGLGSHSFCTNGLPAFKFRSRNEVMDWRRLSAIDVDRVARELDVTALQENIMSVTFCNLDLEKCSYCQNPVDPVLLKVFKLAQMTTEYLLHSQEYLTGNIQILEERHQMALEQLEQTKGEMDKQAEELKSVKEEGKRRKKMISTLQLLVQAGANNYHKCQFCDKAFMNYSYLQAHLVRRHPEITETERKKKQQTERIENEIEELRERLRLTHSQLEAEREAVAFRKTQELEEFHRRDEAAKKEFEDWKDGERKKFYHELDCLRQQLLHEFQDIALKNSNIEATLQEIQSRGLAVSNMGTLHDERDKEELRDLQERIDRQKNDWKKKMRELQNMHQTEKEEMQIENERLRSTLTSDQRSASDSFQTHIRSLTTKLKQQDMLIKTHEEMIRKLSTRPVQVAVVQAVESEEEDEDVESSLEGNQHLKALRQDPNFIKQFRPILEETLEEKLEDMGVKKGSKGISTTTLKSLSLTVSRQREMKAKQFAEFNELRARFMKGVTQKVKQRQKSEGHPSPPPLTPKAGRIPSNAPQKAASKLKQPQTVHSRSSAPQVTVSSRPHVIHSKPYQMEAPKPAPRLRTTSPSRSAAPNTRYGTQHARTPPFTSEDESIVDSAYVTSAGYRDATKIHVVQSKPKPSRAVLSSDDDWSDTDISTGPLSPSTGISAARAPRGSVVQTMIRSLEKQPSSPVKKPVGGVKILPTFPAAPAGSPKAISIVRKLQLSDDEESDLDISSIEDVSEELALKERNSKPMALSRQGVEPTVSQGTSVWSSSGSRGGGIGRDEGGRYQKLIEEQQFCYSYRR
ncbi:zinc finger protein DZIP1L [Callorhinchus milii]|uniref:zinc finger protein DZIP1L n=1 Tax=Callorhinchus milii TaxID=7868 RepID=UPI000457308E|nr:zinc finger protein DZIP1L [Callorhinchus milii]|eukprot:gi/632934520/ref/XP_007885276.1/ PREDICTED: zinc finger protein DZIP1L-like isoform X2 [Callorhinchus milii]